MTIYDENDKPGGMLRYAIPEYRLTHNMLDKEIESITRLGVSLNLGQKINKERMLEIKRAYEHVVLATGTWKETPLGLGEENFDNVH